MLNTPHINPTAEIAETILLPGDPLRAKFISDNFLSESKQFNAVRGALGFTGYYNGKKISVMGTGMGMPSMGIYSHELINFYGVKNLIRIGSCGAIQENIKLYDIIFGLGTCTNSNFTSQFKLNGSFCTIADFDLLTKAKAEADEMEIANHVGNILTSDTFYSDDEDINDKWRKMGVLAVEMETAALYINAARYGAKALAILTVSDNIMTKQQISAGEREKSFVNMMNIALRLA
jgi:purine-nucleoside phosphorylase